MTEQERRALFFKATGMLYCHSPMWVYQAFCKGIEYEREECAKVCDGFIGADPIAAAIRARSE